MKTMLQLPPFFRWLLPILFSLPFLLVFPLWPPFVMFELGILIGSALLWFDEVYGWKWYAEPVGASPEVQTQPTPPQLVTRSPLFLLAYVPLALFVVTSTGSLVGTGLILAMGLILSFEMWEQRHDQTRFQQRFGQGLAHTFSLTDIQRLWVVGFMIVAVLTWLSL
jgi:hypothetical protein